MNRDVCNGCGRDRSKWERWFYTYSDIAWRGALNLIDTRCQTCATPAQITKRKQNRKPRPQAKFRARR